MIKLLGTVMIVLGSGSAGFGFARAVRAQLRQLNALKLEQKKAVHEENFERAAQLRDEIHKLEEAHKEARESRKDSRESA